MENKNFTSHSKLTTDNSRNDSGSYVNSEYLSSRNSDNDSQRPSSRIQVETGLLNSNLGKEERQLKQYENASTMRISDKSPRSHEPYGESNWMSSAFQNRYGDTIGSFEYGGMTTSDEPYRNSRFQKDGNISMATVLQNELDLRSGNRDNGGSSSSRSGHSALNFDRQHDNMTRGNAYGFSESREPTGTHRFSMSTSRNRHSSIEDLELDYKSLTQTIRQLRGDCELRLSQDRNEQQVAYFKRDLELHKQIMTLANSFQNQNFEFNNLQFKISSLEEQLYALEGEKRVVEGNLKELKSGLTEARNTFLLEIKRLEGLIHDTEKEKEELQSKYQYLLDAKATLDSEIYTYRSLLEQEEERCEMTVNIACINQSLN